MQKRALSQFITALAIITFTFTAKAQADINLGIIPTPQRISEVDSNHMVDLQKAKIRNVTIALRNDVENPEQFYSIRFEGKRITIYHSSSQGLNYAQQTIKQLKMLHKKVPSMLIEDWPAYRLRGWMDDISRGPITLESYRAWQYTTMALLKSNFSNYYTEHTLYQPEYPDLSSKQTDININPDEIINLQLFAHAEKTLRIPFYEHLKDGNAGFNPDNKELYDFLRNRIKAAWKRNPASPFFIIDCDETEQLGTGRAKQLVDRLGADAVYVQHINRCYEMVKQEAPSGTSAVGDRHVVMWGDIVAKNPDMIDLLPADMIYIMWAYEPLESYDHLIKPFTDKGTRFWVAPSLSHSSVMLPAPQRYMKNIANLARDGHKAGAEAFMNTCWDDDGEALFGNCLHGLFWGAEMAWNPINSNDTAEYNLRRRIFDKNFDKLYQIICSDNPSVGEYIGAADLLYRFGELESNPITSDLYLSASLKQPLLEINPVIINRPTEPILNALSHAIGNGYNRQAMGFVSYTEHRIATSIAKIKLQQAIAKRLDGEQNTSLCKKLAEDYFAMLADLKREYLLLWDNENGDYERNIVCDRYDHMGREVLDLDGHVFVCVSRPREATLPLVELKTLYADRPIYYTLDGSNPTEYSSQYTEPFTLQQSATLRAITYNQYGEPTESSQYLLCHKAMGASITLNTHYSTYRDIYSGGGNNALIDGLLGNDASYADGRWQGYWGENIDATITFPSETEVNSVSLRIMQNTFDWILSPKSITIYAQSSDGNWQLIGHRNFDVKPRETGMRLRRLMIDGFHTSTSAIRVVVENGGPLPQWHPAPAQPSYLFCDEIMVQ